MPWIGGYFWGSFAASFSTAVFANWFTMRIFTNRRLVELGLWWNRASFENLTLGLAGGVGAAAIVLAPPLLTGAAHLVPIPAADQSSFGAAVFLTTGLIIAATAEELMMRGYAFQVLLAAVGTWATVIPVGVVFALLHSGNPNATWFSVANTAGFGILFGFAFVRTRDLWMPIGLHFGWNFTLPLFGVNVSGLRMRMTGHEMVWSAGNLWSGGDYGPEASILTSAVMILLAFFIWKAPVHRQPSPLSDPPEASEVCEPSPALPS
jgi:membrane protease YdiL (CAAX protease family)